MTRVFTAAEIEAEAYAVHNRGESNDTMPMLDRLMAEETR